MAEFKIAEILGLPVSAMKRVLSAEEFSGWIKYLAQKPPDVQEIQMAILATIVSNALGGKAKVEKFILSGKNNKSDKPGGDAISPESVKTLFRGML